MKATAAVLVAPQKLEIQDIEIPETKDDELLLRVEMVSICGSDPHIYKAEISQYYIPMVMGHEMVGWVEEAGKSAAEFYGVKVGDHITIEPYVQCGNCRYCKTGNYMLCENKKCYGVPTITMSMLSGAYATHMKVIPGSKIHKVADNVPPEAACLSSVVGNGVRWSRTRGKVGMFNTLVIIGAGSQGLSSLIAAKIAGASPIIVTGLTCDKAKLELAKEYGADFIIDAEKESVVDQVDKITGGEMADVVIEASGSVRGIQTAQNVLRPMGVHMQAGMPSKEVPMQLMDLLFKELTIVGGMGQSWDVEDAMKIINTRKFAIEKMITHKFPLEKADEAIRFSMSGNPECIKVALDCE